MNEPQPPTGPSPTTRPEPVEPPRYPDVYDGPVLQCWYRLIDCTQAATYRLTLRCPNGAIHTIAVCPDHRRLFVILGPSAGFIVKAEQELP